MITTKCKRHIQHSQFEFKFSFCFVGADSFSFAPKGGLQGVDEVEEEEESFVWRAVMLLKDCGKAWGSRHCLAVP